MAHFSARISIRISLLHIVIATMLLWLVLGEPASDVANLFFSTGPAPWEKIDLVYYPDMQNPSVSEITNDVGSLEECRSWARHQSLQYDDPGMERGSYECRTGYVGLFGSQQDFRLSLK